MKHLDTITIFVGILTILLGIAGIIAALILNKSYTVLSVCGCSLAVLCGCFALWGGISAKRKRS